jgi:predicted metalloprotease with PDZ domain
LGYIDEGVTTYYGDKFLFTSKVFDWKQYAKTFNQLLSRHYNNFGVNNYSVAQSSFDTWLDGYVKGTPGRKGSIYVEGALIAFMTDIFILKSTNNEKSLNDVMKCLYENFAQQEKGVSDADYKGIVEEIAGQTYDDIYNNYIHGTKNYTQLLSDSLNYIGCDLKISDSELYHEAQLGFMVKNDNGNCIVDNIYPTSMAEELGLSINDEILAINGIKVNEDLGKWSNYFRNEEIVLSVKRELGKITKISFSANQGKMGFKRYEIFKNEENQNFKCWSLL